MALGPSKPAATGSGPGGPPCAAGPGRALANGGSSTAMALRPTQVPSHPAPARAAGCGNLNLLRRTLRRRDGRPAGPAAAASSQAAAPSPSLSRAPPSCQAVARTRTTRLLRVGCQCQWSPGRSGPGPGTSTGTVTSAAAAAPTPRARASARQDRDIGRPRLRQPRRGEPAGPAGPGPLAGDGPSPWPPCY